MWPRKLRSMLLHEKEQAMVDPEAPHTPLVRHSSRVERSHTGPASAAHIGRSLVIQGEVSGQEDVTVDGTIEGVIALRGHAVTIEPHARINAKIRAKTVVIRGEVMGEIEAEERVEIQPTGRLQGTVVSPRVIIADGAYFQGSVEMPDREAEGAPEPSGPIARAEDHYPPPPETSPNKDLRRLA